MLSKHKKTRIPLSGKERERNRELSGAEYVFQEIRVKNERRSKQRTEILLALITILATTIGVAITLPNLFENVTVLGPVLKYGLLATLLPFEIFTLGFKRFPKRCD